MTNIIPISYPDDMDTLIDKSGNKLLTRNDPCHCGSGNKYKVCCMAIDERKRNPKAITGQGRQALMAKIIQDMPEGKFKIRFEDLERIPPDQVILETYDPVEDCFILSVVKIKRQKLVLPDKRIRRPIIQA